MGKIENLKPFKKGDDPRRNLAGRPKLPDLSDLLEEEVGEKGCREVISALLKQAKKGNVKAIQEILDRTYGKTKQVIEQSGTLEIRNVKELTDDELASIAAG